MNIIVRGGAITLAGQLVRAAIQAANLLILSRLLSPRDFGVFAIISAVVALGELLRDFGITPAAIQVDHLSQEQSTGAFWLNVSIGVCLTLALAAGTYLFYEPAHNAGLVTVLPIAGISFVLLGAQAQFQVQLARQHRFATLAYTDVAAQTIGFVVAVALAMLGAGVWSLVSQLLIGNLVLLVLRALSSNWTPGRPQLRPPIAGLVRYGLNVTGAHALANLATRAHTYTIGLRWGATQLGFYDRAFVLLQLPVSQILAPLTNVVLPILSRLQDNEDEFNDTLYSLQVILAGLAALGFAVIVPLAPRLLEFVLGPQWLPSAGLFRILAVGGVFSILSYVSYWVFLARGLTRSLLQYNLISKSLTGLFVVAGTWYSVEAVAWGYTLSLLIAWPLNLLWLERSCSFPATRFLVGGLVILTGGVLATATGWLALGLGGLLSGPFLAAFLSTAVYIGVMMLNADTRRRVLLLIRDQRGA